MPSARTCHQAELCLVQRVAAAPARLQTAVVRGHHLTRDEITNRPEAHDERLGAREEEGAPQPIDTFADPYLTNAGIAGREGYELGAPEIQVRSFERRQNALVRWPLRHIGAAEREARPQQWILNMSGYADGPRLISRRYRMRGRVLEEEPMSGDMQDARGVEAGQHRLRGPLPAEHTRFGKERLDSARLLGSSSQRSEINSRQIGRGGHASPDGSSSRRGMRRLA